MARLLRLIIVLMALCTAGSGPLFAQQWRMSPQERTDTLAHQLSLTAEQKAHVLQILTVADTSMRAAFVAAGDDRRAMRESMQKIRGDTESKMKAVLTDDQYSAWLKMRPAGRGHRGNPNRGK